MGLPKLYRDLSEHNRAVRARFDVSRPLIVVGNGPSAASPLVQHMPADPVVFRMNWFFLEEERHYGTRVDGFFWSIDTAPLPDELAAVLERREYDIRAVFGPMRPTRTTLAGKLVDERHRPQFDHWAVIAENPTFARELMGRPLPTQGFQVLAFALALGFRDIYLTGIDLYESSEGDRYAYRVPEAIARRLPAKDTTPGYEKSHARDRDIAFFGTCRAQYPDARIHALSRSAFLDAHCRPDERAPGGSLYRAKPTFEPGTLRLVGPGSSRDLLEEPYALRDGNKCAFVTMVTGGGFEYGANALAASIRRVSSVPLIVMCTEEADQSLLEGDNMIVREVTPIKNPNPLPGAQDRFLYTFTKLNIFAMTDWDRLVFVDADAILLQNIDELFAIDEFAAAPDFGIELHHERFNSGVLCCQPVPGLFDTMMQRSRSITSYDGGDQGFLNVFFEKPRMLDYRYNTLKRLYVHHPNLFDWSEIKVLHYVGQKPWTALAAGSDEYAPLVDVWAQLISNEQLSRLIRRGRGDRWDGDLYAQRIDRVARKLRKLRRDPIAFFRDAGAVRKLTARFR